MKLSKRAISVLKFEAKLLTGVLVLALLVYFGTNALIAKAADVVTNAYTSGFVF